MATLKFGTIVTAASGKVGGHFFSNGQGGAVLCTNGRTLGKQQTAKKLWGYIKRSAYTNSQEWQNLDDAKRAAWEAEAANWSTFNKVGDAKSLRGYSLFMKVNGLINAVGKPSLTIPGVKVSTSQVTAIAIPSLTVAAFTVNPTVNIAATEVCVIECTRSMSSAAQPGDKDYRIVVVLPDAIILPTSIFTYYRDIFGAPLLGGYINVRASIVNFLTGQQSIKFAVKQIVA